MPDSKDESVSEPPAEMRSLVDWSIDLRAKHTLGSLHELASEERWQASLPALLDDLALLLQDALELMRVLEGADNRRERSYIDRPSISDHEQNPDFRDWATLIVLTRDAWLATAVVSPERAASVATAWWHLPYPCFKRLALFAAAQGALIPTQRALQWLLADEHWWLWSTEVQRETMRLLVALAPRIEGDDRERLEAAILAGPPSGMFGEGHDTENVRRFVDWGIWLRLSRLSEQSGLALGNAAASRFAELSERYPDWRLAPNERDDFPFWWTHGLEEDDVIVTPYRRRELIDWLPTHPERDSWKEDFWRERCRDAFPAAVCALKALGDAETWVPARWQEALYAWVKERHLKRSWHCLSPLLLKMPDRAFLQILGGVSFWLESVAKVLEGSDRVFLALTDRVMALAAEGQGGDAAEGSAADPVHRAINHPVGRVTQALLHLWRRAGLEDRQGLSEPYRSRFTALLADSCPVPCHGRLVLACDLVILFRVDPDWTTQALLPLFDWHDPRSEALAAWKGFLGTGRLYPPLLAALKPAFLKAADHHSELAIYGDNYVSMLTVLALEQDDRFSVGELCLATHALDEAGLSQAARTLRQALQSAGDQRETYFQHRIVPYFRKIWPKTREHRTPVVAGRLAELCIMADACFPEAVELVRHWLVPVDSPYGLLHRLKGSGLCGRFPESSLELLGRVIGEGLPWVPRDLAGCLEAIVETAPGLKEDLRFRRLRVLHHVS